MKKIVEKFMKIMRYAVYIFIAANMLLAAFL